MGSSESSGNTNKVMGLPCSGVTCHPGGFHLINQVQSVPYHLEPDFKTIVVVYAT